MGQSYSYIMRKVYIVYIYIMSQIWIQNNLSFMVSDLAYIKAIWREKMHLLKIALNGIVVNQFKKDKLNLLKDWVLNPVYL